MPRKGATLTLIVLAILAAIYAVTLQLTGQPVQAERFVEWAGGGSSLCSCWRGSSCRPRRMKAPVSGQLFVCGKRTPDLPPCVCGAARRSDVSCRFALSGAKAGQFCAKPLCQRCAQKVDGKTLCQAHARLVAMRDQNAAAVVKNGADDPVTAKIRAVYEELIAAKASIQRLGAP